MNSWPKEVFIRLNSWPKTSVHTVFIRCSYGVHIDQSPREFLRALVGNFLKDLGQKTSNSDLKMRCGA